MRAIVSSILLVGIPGAVACGFPAPPAPRAPVIPLQGDHTDARTSPSHSPSPATKTDQAVSSPVTTCQPGCVLPLDCVHKGAPPTHDLNNYECLQGICVFTGCTSDAECRTRGDYLCRDIYQTGTPICEPACAEVSDCNFGTLATDSDNYTCVEGLCVYAGCNTDSECASFGSYVCRELGPGGSFCVPACETRADCDWGSAPFDSDNYQCTPSGFCQYLGCGSDAECESHTLGTVCRETSWKTPLN